MRWRRPQGGLTWVQVPGAPRTPCDLGKVTAALWPPVKWQESEDDPQGSSQVLTCFAASVPNTLGCGPGPGKPSCVTGSALHSHERNIIIHFCGCSWPFHPRAPPPAAGSDAYSASPRRVRGQKEGTRQRQDDLIILPALRLPHLQSPLELGICGKCIRKASGGGGVGRREPGSRNPQGAWERGSLT